MTAPRNRILIGIAVVIAVVAVIGGIGVWSQSSSEPREDAPISPADASLIADDTRFLDRPDDASVTVVEFIDFECEVCRAFYPHVEQLREDYEGRIEFAVRYFPMPGHPNSVPAALAAEAAGEQDRFEEMYARLLETQEEWHGTSAVDQTPYFRQLAAEIGLDLDDYDAAVADDATVMRVAADFEEGRALGVEGTPTFFVDGEVVELTAFEDLERAVVAALDD
ncbi:thioredoxin domain-containing protein [Aeromicrobium sp. YIM 150415]|uniref:DsbA family protein n=1 Tax=Aeromicrobium sp. YIM 150415 TaxID=2803912 RepID=UPI001963490F|nr:thioredoxin domain-containing protein [Aeromicrobium sp. YIM 150415]MBM9462791.1 thioredoxin domain-containing protein [Aeromicrobium sp. YIM 150415]